EARGARALVAVADVGDADAVTRAFREAGQAFGRVDGVVHCAAVLAYGRFEDVPVEVFDGALQTTLGGTANVARSALTAFAASSDGGSLVVIGSLLGKISTPWMSSYVTAKWGVHGLVRTLQIEARSTPGIQISLVSPGGVDTPVYLQAGTYLRRHGRPPPPVDPPEKVARAVVRALARPRREVSVGAANHLAVTGFRLMPAVFDRLVTPLMRAGGISRSETGNSPGNVLQPQPHGDALHGRWGRHWLRPVAAAAAATAVAATARAVRTTRASRTTKITKATRKKLHR
ncbi:MAG: SDR family NAD(P)-dependent oxidoreductase, partial [Pedococcus sp.]